MLILLYNVIYSFEEVAGFIPPLIEFDASLNIIDSYDLMMVSKTLIFRFR